MLHHPISLYHIFIHQILKFLSRCHLLNFLTAQIAASLSYRRGCLNLVNFALSSFKVIHLQFSSYNWLVSLIHSHILDRFMPLASWSSTTSVRTVLQLQLKFNSFSITISLPVGHSVDINWLQSFWHFRLEIWAIDWSLSPSAPAAQFSPTFALLRPSYCHFGPFGPLNLCHSILWISIWPFLYFNLALSANSNFPFVTIVPSVKLQLQFAIFWLDFWNLSAFCPGLHLWLDHLCSEHPLDLWKRCHPMCLHLARRRTLQGCPVLETRRWSRNAVMSGGGTLLCVQPSLCLRCHWACQRSTPRPLAVLRCHPGCKVAVMHEQAARSSMSFPKDWISASGSASIRSPRTSAGCALNCGPFHSPFETFFVTLQSLRFSLRSWIHHWSVWNSRCISSFSSPCRLGSSQRLSLVVLPTRCHLRRGHPASDNASPPRRSRRSSKQSWSGWNIWNNVTLNTMSWAENSKSLQPPSTKSKTSWTNKGSRFAGWIRSAGTRKGCWGRTAFWPKGRTCRRPAPLKWNEKKKGFVAALFPCDFRLTLWCYFNFVCSLSFVSCFSYLRRSCW